MLATKSTFTKYSF